MKPVAGNASASAIRCSPPPKPISSLTFSMPSSNNSVSASGAGAEMSSERCGSRCVDQVGLMRAQLMALAPPEERAA